MLKRDVTYEDFDGQTLTETFYFNLSKTELIEMQNSVDGGLDNMLQQMLATNNMKEILGQFKTIILMSYGVRSDDGKRFIKNDQVREEFSQTAAFDALFMDLAVNEDSVVNFIKGVMPKDMLADIEAISAVPTPPLPPGN